MSRIKKWDKVVAAVVAAIAIVLLVYVLIEGQQTTTDSDRMGMGSHTYSSTNLALIVVASFLIALAVMFIFVKEEYEPLPPNMEPNRPLPPPPPVEEEQPSSKTLTASPAQPIQSSSATEDAKELAAKENYLVLRLLTGDERLMFKAIMDAGGEALQKDLIKSTKMSNAKVSRVLDRLEEKGVISKDRHGSTNKVRIKLER